MSWTQLVVDTAAAHTHHELGGLVNSYTENPGARATRLICDMRSMVLSVPNIGIVVQYDGELESVPETLAGMRFTRFRYVFRNIAPTQANAGRFAGDSLCFQYPKTTLTVRVETLLVTVRAGTIHMAKDWCQNIVIACGSVEQLVAERACVFAGDYNSSMQL